MLSTAATIVVGVVYPQCSFSCQLAGTYNFRKYLLSSFSLQINFYFYTELVLRGNSEFTKQLKSGLVSSVVVKTLLRVYESQITVNHIKSLHNKSRLFKHPEVFSYLQYHQPWDIIVFSKSSYSETWHKKHPGNDSNFVLLYIHRLARWI